MITTRKSMWNVSYSIRIFQIMTIALMGFAVYILIRTLTTTVISTWTPWVVTLFSALVGFVAFDTACDAAKKEYELQERQLDRVIVMTARDLRELIALIIAVGRNFSSWIWRHAPLHFLPKEQRRPTW